MADTSPKWKKPSDVMKIIRKKRKVVIKPRESQKKEHSLSGKSLQDKSATRKRKNPFSCSPRKRANNQQSQPDSGVSLSNGQEATDLFSILDGKEVMPPSSEDTESLADQEQAYFEKQTQNDQTPIASEVRKEKDEKVKGSPTYPFDWALRTKMRVISKKTFNWCAPLKSKEETGGLVRFTQKATKSDSSNLAAKSEEFQQHCAVWQHPNLPWLKLFPRMVGDGKIGKATCTLSEDIQQSLQDDWLESFTSIYQMLRNGHCPYFYLCSHQQTVLYRQGYYHGSDGIQAVVSPTSRGFRESLKAEDIEFSMPLNPRSSNNQKDMDSLDDQEEKEPTDIVPPAEENKEVCGEGQEERGEDEDIEGTNEGASSWLEGLGLDKKKFRSLNPNQVKLQRDSFKLIDNRPESMVVVEGFHTHTLFNYLLNYRGFLANTGVQTGVPPTILAPTAFKGATLKSLKVKQGALRQQQTDGNVQKGYSVEVTGPILPYCYQNLLSLLVSTQTDLSATFSIQEPSIPFNGVPRGGEGEEWTENKTHPVNLGKEAIRELICENDVYSWTVY